ncbi:FtsK/SpoIIIE domain-containing protein [Cellulomonas sp.]|uniref:FtsK/SpoIIIE domain-containing protein n=1 Tax=Cellulomonas sp. TaxID=40001 RepID=UPI001B18EBA3|nr:FtsK/SpoIIIE domain-containing protein [Cellulomonas sp.]MBO9556706.1 FHA domain-containing protein [Cellulomonas sp.]
MRTRLTLRRPGGVSTDVVVTTDAGATVGDIAEAVARVDGLPAGASGGGVTLLASPPDGRAPRTLHRAEGVVEAGLRAGSTVALVAASDRFAEPGLDPRLAHARLRVEHGPQAGLELDLPRGVVTIGRGPACDVRLTDQQVSKLHARLVVDDRIRVVDAGSANGVLMDNARVDDVVLGPDDRVTLGETVLSVTRLRPADAGGEAGATVRFNRSPRVVPTYPERAVDAPAPPEPASPGRFPLVALAAPLLMGVALMLFAPSPLSALFIALSPVIMVGTWLDRRYNERRRLRTQTSEFHSALEALGTELEQAQAEEVRVRLTETPSTAEAVQAGLDLTPLLWSRRPEHDRFLDVRLGIGRAPSRTTVTMPARGRAVTELWTALQELRDSREQVDGVPLVVDLRTVGALGVAGPDGRVDDVVRGVVAQLVCLHSPAELVVTGVVSAPSVRRWDWLKWVPHVQSPHSPLAGAHLATSPAAASSLVQRLEELVASRTAHGTPRTAPLPAVVVVVEDATQGDRARLVRLAEDGPAAGVHVLWCAATVEQLPAVCRAFLAVDPDGSARVGLVRDGEWQPVTCEGVDAATADTLARRMSAVADAGAPVIDESDLPRSISFLALAGEELADDPASVVDRWRQTGSVIDRSGAAPVRRRRDAGLRALVGQGSAGEFVLDLRSQGPHALVGGTTGAGKSEFLQAWVLGLATAHSPDRISFLFVDYKGGSAFADCVDLPHSVGLVTDLSPHLVRRALTSLRAELRHREHLLNRKKAKDLLTLERAGDPDAPPALVIVVDEFAALVSEVPEFVDGVVDVAQRGRSLGLHLILATQRPAGVIKDNLRANTNLRVALRMADEHDSEDVLGSSVAAAFDPGIPGRAAVRTGPGRVAMFQSGYAGGRSTGAPPRPSVGLETLVLGPGDVWDVPVPTGPETADDGPTDIARVVRTVRTAAAALRLPAPRRPWLPELPPVVDLADLGPQSDAALAFGLVDVPARQAQDVLRFCPDQDGSLAVLGTSGSGKSAVLRTIAVAAGLAQDGPVHVYGLDFGSGGLGMIAPLPHVGSVVDGSDTERVTRLLRRLRDDVDERAARFGAARAGTITEYRTLAGRPDEPRLVLLLDGLGAFRESYESEPGRAQTWAAFQRVVAEGRTLGVHVVMAGERPGALPSGLAGSVSRRLVLRQADEAAYGVLDVPKDVLGPQSRPGRAVVSGDTDEVQVAVPGGSTTPAEQAAAIERLAAAMRERGVVPAPAVRRLASFVELSDLPSSVGGQPVLGIADDTLEPVGFDPAGVFMLAGLPGSGRTTVLRSLSASVRRALPSVRMAYVGNRRSPVHSTDGVWTDVALDPESAAALAKSLLPSLVETAVPGAQVVVVVETITDFLGGPAEQPLAEAVRAAKRNGHLLIAESETSTWGSSWPLVADVRNGRRGLVLQPDHLDGDALFRTPFPRMARAEFPVGRGVYVESGRLRRVQIPVAD